MSIRSTTGCYACKTRRKKCDETKPKCMKSRMECEYEYLPSTGRSTKKRTKPAPRPASEQARRLEKQEAKSTIISEIAQVSETLNACATPFGYPQTSLEILLPLDTDWGAVHHPLAATHSLEPLSSCAAPLSVVSRRFAATPTVKLTPGQASLFNALFSLGEANSLRESNSLSASVPPHSPPRFEPSYHTPQSHELNYYPQYASSSSARLDESKTFEDDNDLEGVQEIFYRTPLGLDRMVDSNSLPFVLQSCTFLFILRTGELLTEPLSVAQWLPLTLFDPLKIIHTARDVIINQFSQSPTLRSRLILISELIVMLAKSWSLDGRGMGMLQLLRGEIWQNITEYQPRRYPVSGEEERQRACTTLDNLMELMSIQMTAAPLSVILRLLQSAAPVFLSACPPPHPPYLPKILLEPGLNLRHFAAVDIAISVTTGRPLLCRYNIPWSLELCDEFMKKRENHGLQWLVGIPDQFIMLFAYMNGLKEDAETLGTPINPRIIAQIEEDMKKISILPCDSRDPSLALGRMVVQECWREVVFIYLYMALCEAHALDSRVAKAQKGFIKLMNGIKPGRNPDAFLTIPTLIAGVATTKPSHRQTIRSRILGLPHCNIPNTAGNDSLLILEDVWARTELEGRVARWGDLREACRRITGV
ncbi:unnamed protein product [Rhizoctonia solani]|uniref:Zn(2)-C6 fungal-type domain-containing protein n=1 Tax=Rhizoctonia solani TaxID=456999 RepID=A0A8H3I0L7_9AGAM|nr:unnamed protein product [Rhizoctonia solani]